jgi:hypothetical protein
VVLSTLFTGSDFPAAGAFSNSFIASMLALWNAISTDPAYLIWRRITVPMDAAAGLALAAAGIGLLLLRNWSRLLSISCAIYKILFAFLDCAVLFVVLHRVLANALQAGTGGEYAFVAAAALLGAVLTLVYPVLLIYFLTRPKAVQAFQPAPLPSL